MEDTLTLSVSGMSCASCVNAIESGLKAKPGVVDARVALISKKATITYRSDELTAEEITQSISALGFDAKILQHKPGVTSHTAIIKVGGMNCASCVRKIESGLGQEPGITDVRVNLIAQKATVSYNPNSSSAVAVVRSIQALGFEATDVTPAPTSVPMGTATATLKVTGMSCGSCVGKIETGLAKLDGVKEVRVNLMSQKAVVEYRPGLTTAATIADSVKDLGFAATVLSDTGTTTTATATIEVTGMSCGSCVGKIESRVKQLEGVDSVRVNLMTKKAVVDFHPAVTTAQAITTAITEAGFDANLLESTATDQDGVGGKDDGGNPQLEEAHNLWQDLKIALLFTVPIFFVAMVFSQIAVCRDIMDTQTMPGVSIQDLLLLIMTTPVQFYAGRRFHKNAWKALKHKHTNMDVLVSMGTNAAYFYSVIVVVLEVALDDFQQKTFFETSAMLVTFILTGKFVECFAKHKTSEALTKLLKLQPPTAQLLIMDGDKVLSEREVGVEYIQVGDRVIVRSGGRVPLDGVVVHGQGHVDESMVTGESMPVFKPLGKTVIGGTILESGVIHVKVEKIGEDTALAQIIKLVEDAQSSKAPIQALADRISAVFVPFVILISLITFLGWAIAGYTGAVPDAIYDDANASESLLAFVFSVSVLVVSCPCTLGLATPTAVVAGTGRGATLGILIKGADILQRAEKVRHVVFDKTGTLTHGTPEVTSVLLTPSAKAQDLTERGLFQLLGSAEHSSSHPLARAVCRHAGKLHRRESVVSVDSIQIEAGNALGFAPLPVTAFDVVDGCGLTCRVGDKTVAIGNRSLVTDQLSLPIPNDVESYAQEQEEEGQTVVFAVLEGELVAAVTIADTVKAEASAVIARLHQMGVGTLMLTGDNLRTGMAIARKLGVGQVLAETKPADKASKIRELQRRGKGLVAMVGDGVNDSPALVTADLGVAIGSGTDVAVEAADIVLMKSSLWDVVVALDLSRTIFKRIRLNFLWAFGYNVLAIPIAAGALFPSTRTMLEPHWAGAAMAASSICVVTSSMLLRWYRPPQPPKLRKSKLLLGKSKFLGKRSKVGAEPMAKQKAGHVAVELPQRKRACSCGDECACKCRLLETDAAAVVHGVGDEEEGMYVPKGVGAPACGCGCECS